MKSVDRNISLDLLRVLIMFMIVLGHSLVHGGVLDNATVFSATYFVGFSLSAFLNVHVDCFVLLSGYLGYQKQFTFRKVMKIWLQVFFWSVALFFFVSLIQGNGIQVKEMVKSFLPITQQRYWFMTTYLLMYLLTPLLNSAISAMNHWQHKQVLMLYSLAFIVLQNVVFWREFTGVNSRSPLFFCFLYMVGAYFHKYPVDRKIPWLVIYIASCGISAIYRFAVTAITLPRFGEPMGETFMGGYSSALTVIGAIALFMTFATVKIRCNEVVAKTFAFISPLTLGVYLIHDNASLRTPLWSALDLVRFIDSGYLVPILLLASLAIFTICIILEWLRSVLFEACRLNALMNCIGEKLDHLMNRLSV